ncbi:hypothetical protein LIL_13325 [Leptospira interrogans serovar Linhai str. 56609]|uniref:Uncharacterized protein n=1 Tax=Leptospira interrogans serogroup Icterohaemorrhagiae serovar copenhageni (strain Fiocruz L1-130) TaxID=267671 RepID=Q72MF9_LEPIC|nr:conserved hypothetical protein [Leptospira interrogans serovar Copenhageni str. Fiocruz L1-130]AJR15927.1 hypothetical protein LIL_13325 [Leptospira interrogans serovar Linhai str. 56609]EKO87135.1 hypothetical protein LEP1GSC009_4626 [Leptospira interrogans serovar Grippotyphosa str. Andaman]
MAYRNEKEFSKSSELLEFVLKIVIRGSSRILGIDLKVQIQLFRKMNYRFFMLNSHYLKLPSDLLIRTCIK